MFNIVNRDNYTQFHSPVPSSCSNLILLMQWHGSSVYFIMNSCLHFEIFSAGAMYILHPLYNLIYYHTASLVTTVFQHITC